MRLSILCIVIFQSSVICGQSALPILSKKQMYADFDTLYHVISTTNPHDFVRKKVNGYAMLDSIKALRKEIDNTATTESFYWLINRALTFCQDGHTSVVRKYLYEYVAEKDRQGSSFADTTIIDLYSKIRAERLKAVNLSVPIKYIRGRYIVLQSFSVNKTNIPENAILTKINGMPVHGFVRTKLPYKKDLHWDFTNKRFYADDFYNSFDISLTDNIQFNFEKDKKIFLLSANLSDSVSTASKLVYMQSKEVKRVAYFVDKKILYIRMPIMWDSTFYLAKIDSLQNTLPANSIKKVVLDVRDNAGGNDGDWVSVISRFLHKPIIRNITKCFNASNFSKDRIYADSFRIFKNAFVNNGAFLEAINTPDTILPYKNTIGFSGKIYVLQNENCFSATGDLISTCQFTDQMVNIGYTTGWFGGFGSMPWVYILPHSKILYWTEPLLDFTNVTKPEDLFHNEVKVPIQLSVTDYAHRYTYKNDWYGKEFLFKYDKVFKAVLKFDSDKK